MFILDEYQNTWNYTFIIVMAVAITIGAVIELRKWQKNRLKERREKRNNNTK